MFRGARARERVFQVVMWIVSVVLAAFLIGLGSLVIGDLPKVSQPVQLDQFVDRAGLRAMEARRDQASIAADRTRALLEQAQTAVDSAGKAYGDEKETFDNWVQARTATASNAQNPEVLARTQKLDQLKAAEQASESSRDKIQGDLDALAQRVQSADVEIQRLRDAAQPAFERAKFLQELKVFGLRLALTLPLLVISAWLLFRKSKGDYWPLQRGFILFSAFAFFVELVPYLPEYGGYVRYGVGVLLTLVVGHFVIKGMRAYLKAREVDEARAEVERVKSIQYDQALKKLGERACPGCERALPAVEGAQLDYCVHCGMHLFNRCPSCQTRKFAFFRYCMSCGTPAAPELAPAGADPA